MWTFHSTVKGAGQPLHRPARAALAARVEAAVTAAVSRRGSGAISTKRLMSPRARRIAAAMPAQVPVPLRTSPRRLVVSSLAQSWAMAVLDRTSEIWARKDRRKTLPTESLRYRARRMLFHERLASLRTGPLQAHGRSPARTLTP